MRVCGTVLRSPIDVGSQLQALQRVNAWADRRESRCIYFCNVHSVVTAHRSAGFAEVLRTADLALPDGAPVAWALRRAGNSSQRRVSGPDLMWRYLGDAERTGHVVSFYGDTSATLQALRQKLSSAFPALRIGVMISPPFRTLTDAEDQAFVDEINSSGTQVLFVGLGCPKQERWIAAHRGRIFACMLGVGAALPFHAGLSRRAPLWMQSIGAEWLHRVASEPRRLAWRYAATNSIFIAEVMKQAVRSIRRRTH